MDDIYVYDFDETIYDGDVTADFYKYCLKHNRKVLKHIFFQIWAFFKYLFGFTKWTQFKGDMLGYFKYLDDIDSVVDNFWQENKHKIKDWYLKKDHSKDVIISASPECLLKKICYNYLKVNLLIGTLADEKTGKITKQNCYGNQKVKRLNEILKNYKIKEFYSDSLSDAPLADLAEQSYIVLGDNLINWQKYTLPWFNKLKLLFLSRDFILFVMLGVINTFNSVVFSLIFNKVIVNTSIAFCWGYILSNVVAYLLNTTIIFKEKLSLVKYIKFFISYIPNFLIQLAIVFIICDILGGCNLLAYIVAAVIGVPVTFLCLKLFAFKPVSANKNINPYLFKEL